MEEITTSILHDWTYTHICDHRTQIVLARFRIGYTYLTQRYMLTRDPQPYCDDCLVPLTVRHLLVECSSLIDLRHRYFYQYRGRDSGSMDRRLKKGGGGGGGGRLRTACLKPAAVSGAALS
ncbi:hypothetical protein E2C01_088260 [Portunus trituberculatus]|uniref:Uncharacterized protein n=1 Tax=Portunus trituberculatus TaxID=210409 RepID=A0A5B7JJD5_PORTR|nr:hypothetical protein [Portunus trituberculatus]